MFRKLEESRSETTLATLLNQLDQLVLSPDVASYIAGDPVINDQITIVNICRHQLDTDDDELLAELSMIVDRLLTVSQDERKR